MSDYCKIKGMECEFVLGEKKCLIDRTCKYINEWLIEHEKQIRADVIDKVEEKLKSTGCKITFNMPVEETFGAGIDLDDFVMLVQDAVKEYKNLVLGVLEQLKDEL